LVRLSGLGQDARTAQIAASRLYDADDILNAAQMRRVI
jgi:hypothetical protein